jgi:nucleoside 2-deoxyribosyltransferase
MKAYITCPASISKERLDILPKIRFIVERKGIEPFVFEIGGTPEDIFERDYNQLKSSDIIIAEVSEPSHGVGVEIGLSVSLDLKRILLIQEGKKLSNLVKGIPNTEIIKYSDSDDLINKLNSSLNKIKR